MKWPMLPPNGNSFLPRYNAILSTVTVVAIVVAALWYGVIGPQGDRIKELETHTIGLREHDEFRVREDMAREAMHKEIDKEVDGLTRRVDRIEGGLVSRSEHEEHWKEDAERVAEVSARLSEFRNQMAGTYTIGD